MSLKPNPLSMTLRRITRTMTNAKRDELLQEMHDDIKEICSQMSKPEDKKDEE